MKKQKNVSLKVYPNRIKQNKTTGNCPVYLKLTYSGQKVETRLDASLDLTSSELHLWDEMLMRVRTKDSTLNNYIHVVEQKFVAYKSNLLTRVMKIIGYRLTLACHNHRLRRHRQL
jgi:hypothetical protein